MHGVPEQLLPGRWGKADADFAAFLTASPSWLVLCSAEARGELGGASWLFAGSTGGPPSAGEADVGVVRGSAVEVGVLKEVPWEANCRLLDLFRAVRNTGGEETGQLLEVRHERIRGARSPQGPVLRSEASASRLSPARKVMQGDGRAAGFIPGGGARRASSSPPEGGHKARRSPSLALLF